MVTGFKYGHLNVSRQGNQFSVREDTGGRRSLPSTDITISANDSGDQYQIRGEKEQNNIAWDLKVSQFGVEARDVSSRNSWGAETRSVEFPANVVRNFERAALGVAGSIVGVPLDFLAKDF